MLEVRDSDFGVGLFTKEDLPAGLSIHYFGKFYSDSKAVEEANLDNTQYVIAQSRHSHHVDGLAVPVQYATRANHKPHSLANAELIWDEDYGEYGQPKVELKDNVCAGQEIRVDYGRHYDYAGNDFQRDADIPASDTGAAEGEASDILGEVTLHHTAEDDTETWEAEQRQLAAAGWPEDDASAENHAHDNDGLATATVAETAVRADGATAAAAGEDDTTAGNASVQTALRRPDRVYITVAELKQRVGLRMAAWLGWETYVDHCALLRVVLCRWRRRLPATPRMATSLQAAAKTWLQSGSTPPGQERNQLTWRQAEADHASAVAAHAAADADHDVAEQCPRRGGFVPSRSQIEYHRHLMPRPATPPKPEVPQLIYYDLDEYEDELITWDHNDEPEGSAQQDTDGGDTAGADALVQ
jgi:hypothetical protein